MNQLYLIKIFNNIDYTAEAVHGEKVESNIFRIIENPIFCGMVTYGTVVEGEIDEIGELVFKKVKKKSPFVTKKFVLPAAGFRPSDLKDIGDKIVKAGGNWEIVFGGIAYIHLPKKSKFDLEKEFDGINFYPVRIVD